MFVELDLGRLSQGWAGWEICHLPLSLSSCQISDTSSFTGPSHLDYSQKLLVLLVLIALQSKQIILAF